MARELLNKDGSPMREHNSPIIEQLLKEMEMVNKLYTEQQVLEMIQKSRETGLTAEYLVLATKAIELPSDEEIAKGRDENIPINEKDMWSERFYFTVGAKWMRDKIQGGNK